MGNKERGPVSAYSPVFVYLGRSLPDYAKFSLSLFARTSGQSPILLGNDLLRKSCPDAAAFLAVEDFYDSSEFLDASSRLSNSRSFRQGFWLRTLERFFVLYQFMQASKITHLFHAELDQLLFQNEILVNKLLNFGQPGLYFPMHGTRLAIASVMFVHHPQSLRHLLDFVQDQDGFENEMVLLSDWARLNHGLFHRLPTLGGPDVEVQTAGTPDDCSRAWVVDAAQLGQWVGGEDPRNVRLSQSPRSKFAHPDGPELAPLRDLEQVRFHYEPKENSLHLTLRGPQDSYQLFNLHLHSKIHGWLHNEGALEILFRLANGNSRHRFPGTRQEQVKAHLTEFFLR